MANSSWDKITTLPRAGTSPQRRPSPPEILNMQRRHSQLIDYISATYGNRKTRSETEFVNAVKRNGRLSTRLAIIFGLTMWFMTNNYVHVFTIGESNKITVRCVVPELEEHFDFFEVVHISFHNKTPTIHDFLNEQYCAYEKRNYAQLISAHGYDYNLIRGGLNTHAEEVGQESCKSYAVLRGDKTVVLKNRDRDSSSIREEFRLFCDKQVWHWTFWVILYYGCFSSHFVMGVIADIFGRKPAFILTLTFTAIGYGCLFLPNRSLMILARFIIGWGHSAPNILYVYQICDDRTWLWMGHLVYMYLPLATFLSYIVYQLVNKWRLMHLINCCMLLMAPLAFWWVTESPRWLMFTENKAEAWKVLKKLGSRAEPNSTHLVWPKPERPTLKKLIQEFAKHGNRERIIACSILSFLSSISIMIESKFLSLNFYSGRTNFYLLTASFQILAILIGTFISIYKGRRFACFIICSTLILLDGTLFLAYQILSDELMLPAVFYAHFSLRQSFRRILKFYICEMFSTQYRATALNSSDAFFFLGNIVQIHLYSLLLPEQVELSYMPIFVTAVTCALMICFLPKTDNHGLPDTPREALYIQLYAVDSER